MRLLQKNAGYTMLDRKRNDTIQNKLNVKRVIKRVTEYRRRRRRHDHVNRMEEDMDRSPKWAAHYTPRSRRDRGMQTTEEIGGYIRIIRN